MMLEQMLAQWRHPVASIEASNLLHQAICMVSYQCIVISIKMASNVVHRRCFAWFSGGCRGNTEQVVAQWRYLEASGVAQDMLHRAMHSVLHRCTAMASEIASGRGTSIIHR
jgi:hypothetical protein